MCFPLSPPTRDGRPPAAGAMRAAADHEASVEMAAPEKQAKAAADEVSVEVAEGVVRTQRTDDELLDVYPQTPSVRLSENAAAAAALPDAAVPEAAGSFKKAVIAFYLIVQWIFFSSTIVRPSGTEI